MVCVGRITHKKPLGIITLTKAKTKPERKKQPMKTIEPIKFFEDWWNNYLTTEKIAEHYGITQEKAIELINKGRIEWNKTAAKQKGNQ